MRYILFICFFLSFHLNVFSQEELIFFGGQPTLPVFTADASEIKNEISIAQMEGEEYLFTYQFGEYIPLLSRQETANGIDFSMGVYGLFRGKLWRIDDDLETSSRLWDTGIFGDFLIKNGGARLLFGYESADLSGDSPNSFKPPQNSFYRVYTKLNISYEWKPDLWFYLDIKNHWKQKQSHKNDFIWGGGFQYTFGKGYYRPFLGIDLKVIEKEVEDLAFHLRLGIFLGHMDEFIVHQIYFEFSSGAQTTTENFGKKMNGLELGYSWDF